MLISRIDTGYADGGGVSSPSLGTTAVSGNGAAAAGKQADNVLAENSSVVTALSSGTSSNLQTYSSAGLLNGNVWTGTGTYPNYASPPAALQQTVNKGIVATLSAKAVGAGVYNGMGLLESLPLARVTDLGSLLRNNPQLSYVQAGNSYNKGLIVSLDIIA